MQLCLMINCDVFCAASTIFDYLPFYRKKNSIQHSKNHPNNKKENALENPACVCVCVCVEWKNSPKRNKTNECKAKESEIISYSISKKHNFKRERKETSTLFFLLKETKEKR